MLRIFNTLVILIGIGLFGLFDFAKDRLFGGLNTYDVFLILVNIVFLNLYQKKRVKILVKYTPCKYIYYIYLFSLAVILSMPLRGEISIIDSVKVGRNFLLIPLMFLVWYDTVKNGYKYYQNFVIFISLVTSIQIIITAINPNWISSIFPHIRAREFYKYGLQRNDFIANSMLLPHMASLIIFQKIIKTKLKTKLLLFFIVFYLASALQGFRSYFLVLSIVLVIIVIYNIKQMKIKRYLIVSLLLIPVAMIGDRELLNSQISNKFITASMDVEKDQGSSLKGRFERDLVFTIPMFLENPLFGWGFIYSDSNYGKKIGLDEGERYDYSPYVLYSVDSGYLTMLNYFGIIGFCLFFFFFIKYLVSIVKNKQFHESIPIVGFATIITLTLLTHGGLYSIFGLLPFLTVSGYLLGKNYDNTIWSSKA